MDDNGQTSSSGDTRGNSTFKPLLAYRMMTRGCGRLNQQPRLQTPAVPRLFASSVRWTNIGELDRKTRPNFSAIWVADLWSLSCSTPSKSLGLIERCPFVTGNMICIRSTPSKICVFSRSAVLSRKRSFSEGTLYLIRSSACASLRISRQMETN